jgi:tetratricopeptide (TPR) repeat protein
MKHLLISFLFLFSFAVSAQERDKTLPKANDEYNEKNFVEAEANYRISHSKFPKRIVAPFNLGNAIYKQKQLAEAKFAYSKALTNTKSRVQKHKVFHNLGNVFMQEKDYSNAVEAYKNALRNKPSDEETRYNFALAKKMLKENPPKDDKKDKKDDKKKDDKNKEKDKKDEKKDQDKKGGDKDKKDDKGDKDKNKNQDKPGDQGKPKPMPGGINQQRIQNLLDAVNNEEKKIQDKVNAQKVKAKPVQTEKDW